jgi:hypothetical protein
MNERSCRIRAIKHDGFRILARRDGGRIAVVRFGNFGRKGLYRPLLLLARGRLILLVWVAVVAPVSFLIIQHATLYDGVRHTLFVIPMLALLAGWALIRLVPYLRRVVVPVGYLRYRGCGQFGDTASAGIHRDQCDRWRHAGFL